MRNKIVSLLFVGIFLLMCLIPSVGLFLTGGAEAGANEVLAAKPSLTRRDGSLNADVLADGGDYVGDRFYLRQECVTAWAKLHAALFGTSVTESVLLGKNGWLYYEPTLADYTRSEPMTDRELWCAARTLCLLQEYAESRGAKFLFTVAPNKNSLYDENMPRRTRLQGVSNAAALQALLGEMGVHCLDLFAVFASAEETLYFRTDSHWNGKGAALAADAILAALGRESDYAAGPFAPGTHRGDLYEMLCPAGTETEPDLVYAPGFTFTASSQNPDNNNITAQSAAGEGRLLLYRDSFGRNLYPYLAESFAESTISRKNAYDPTPLQSGDVMVVELVERNLRYLLAYPPPVPAPERPAALAEGAAQREETLQLRLANGAAEEYTVLRGVFGTLTPETDSPVYVSAGGALYETVPGPDGFSACLPEAAAREDIRVIFTSGGELVSLPGVMDP